MANAIADDENPSTRGAWAYADGDWDAEPRHRASSSPRCRGTAGGLLAFTINLQGGNPKGYGKDQPWHNSAFTAEGALQPACVARLDKGISACDGLGMVVILGLFYGKQSGTLKDEGAVKTAVTNTVDWLIERSATNVLIEIGNEIDLENAFAHPIITTARCHELIELAKKRSQGRLLVSTSLIMRDAPPPSILASADFLLPHGNRIHGPDGATQPSPHGIRLQVINWRSGKGYRGQPIVYNEDDHFEFDKSDNHFVAAVEFGRELGFLRLPHEPRALRGRLPVAAGRLDDLVGEEARVLRAAE